MNRVHQSIIESSFELFPSLARVIASPTHNEDLLVAVKTSANKNALVVERKLALSTLIETVADPENS
jgi:hypothetical protein